MQKEKRGWIQLFGNSEQFKRKDRGKYNSMNQQLPRISR